MTSDDFVQMVTSVGEAAKAAQGELGAHKLQIQKVEMDVACATTKEADGSIKLGPVEIGGKGSASDVHTITVSLARPEAPRTFAKAALHDDLARAIVAAATASAAARDKLPGLAFAGATVELRVVRGGSGTVKVVLGGAASHEVTHAIRLTLVPA